MIFRRVPRQNSRFNLKISPLQVGIIAFIITVIAFNVYTNRNLLPKHTYYIDTLDTTLPIIYQIRNEKKLNEMRGFRSENYKAVANEKLTILEKDRKLNIRILENGSTFDTIEYSVRDKNDGKLIERTRKTIEPSERKKDGIDVELNIQNLIKDNTTYLLILHINTEDKEAYYFANIIYRPKNDLDEALNQVETFTTKTYNAKEAASLVKYLETSINRDTKEMYNVTLQQTFEQLTFGDTGMKLVSDLYYDIYQAQEYSYNIVVNHFSKSSKRGKTENFINRDEFVLRWDGTRWYYMKFNRTTEELLNLDDNPYEKSNHRFYTGITNPANILKVESENKKYFAFCKQKEVYLYDVDNQTMTNVFSYRIRDKETFEKVAKDFDIKILSVDDSGNVIYIVYGYNMTGYNEGNNGIGIYTYDNLVNESEENLFIPIYTTFQCLKYDLDKLCVFKNNRLIFKSYNKVYSIDKDSSEALTLAEGFEETLFAASDNSIYFAFNNEKAGKSKQINIYNIDDSKVTTIDAKAGENIEVVTFMNDDLFYGVFDEKNIWTEVGKIIGRPSHEIRVLNSVTGKEDSFKEKDKYLYNFVNQKNVLRYNKYSREGNKYTYLTNDVIVNNYSDPKEIRYEYKEELTKDKLRIGYFDITVEKNTDITYKENAGISRKQIEYTALNSVDEVEETIYYVYDSGKLKAKLKNLSDGINEIRDNYGYVKLNDRITCYNRSNKGNVSYLRQNDSILENLKGFEENIYLKNNDVLVMNVTGATERDLEYYISLKEKVAVFKYDIFQFFITGYDNNNYVLEYESGERILTPRDEVHEAVVYGGYVLFAQLENLE